MKKSLLLKGLPIVVLLLVLLSIWILVSKPKTQFTPRDNSSSQQEDQPTSNQTQISASFAIFTNGTYRIFTAPMYHNQDDEIYITQNDPSIVIVKKQHATWNDFFETLPFSLTKDCLTTGTNQTFCNSTTLSLKFFINGMRNDNALFEEIHDKDELLVSFGPINDPAIASQLTEVTPK